MNAKQIPATVAALAAVSLGAWYFGRQFRVDHASQAGASQGSPSGQKIPVHEKTDAPPPTPVHEKAFLEEQLKTNPHHPPILVRLGEVEHSLGQLPEARSHLEQALKEDANLVDARLELSMVCYELKDVAEAERQNLIILKQDPKQADALYNLGAIEANRNQLAKARQYWQDAARYGADSASGKNAAAALAQLTPHSQAMAGLHP